MHRSVFLPESDLPGYSSPPEISNFRLSNYRIVNVGGIAMMPIGLCHTNLDIWEGIWEYGPWLLCEKIIKVVRLRRMGIAGWRLCTMLYIMLWDELLVLSNGADRVKKHQTIPTPLWLYLKHKKQTPQPLCSRHGANFLLHHFPKIATIRFYEHYKR